ncbi:hypothetical protein GCM10009736_15810 [Actinomadura bangladeshensis]
MGCLHGRHHRPAPGLVGDQDPRLPSIRNTAAKIPSATLIELPNCSHLDAFTRTDLTLPTVRHFLAARQAAASAVSAKSTASPPR